MKTKFLIPILLFFFINSVAQNNYDKVITVIVKDFSEACSQNPGDGDAVFCLTDEQGNKLTERYGCSMTANVWEVEPKDLITENWILDSKYKNKKAVLYCIKQKGLSGWIVRKVEFLDKGGAGNTLANNIDNPLKSNTAFPLATVKVCDDSKQLKVIVLNNLVYKIDSEGNKRKTAECSELPIKNGNQFFSTQAGFNDYLKVIIDNNGIVKLFCATESGEKKYLDNRRQHFTMKEIKDGFVIGKIDANKFHPVEKNDATKFNQDGYLYQGNKTQAVICILALDYFQ